MSEKKKTVKKADAVPHTQASPEKLGAAKAELAKMIEGVQNGEKLLELIDTGYKKGKLSSGEMMETLDSISLESDQMDKVYDVLENLGIDTAGDDFPPELEDDILPPVAELEEIPEEEIVDPNTLVDSFAIDDPVRMYLKEIGKVDLLTPEREVELAQAMGAGAAAKEQLAELEKSGGEIPEETLKELKKAEGAKLLAGMRLEEDRVRGLKFYYPSAFRFFSDGSWDAATRCFVLPYLGQEGDRAWVRLLFNYTGDDWVFFKKVTVVADEQRFYKFFNYFDIVRDNGGGDVWEYIDTDGSSDIEMLWAIANSAETIVRFEGDDYSHDFTVKASDKEAIRAVLTAYEALA